jgi:hypothetical protein
MSPHSLITNDEPEVLADSVYGDLQVEGWERAEILLQSNNEEAAFLKQEGQIIRLRASGDCLLRLPYKAKLTIANVHGGAHIKEIKSPVTIRRVLGSLALEGVGATQVDSVYGELLARGIEGSLTIDQVLGNAWVEDVKGSSSLERVAGNLDVRNAVGDVRASARGDVQLWLENPAGTTYKIEASGNIIFSSTKNLDANIRISSRNNDITLSLPEGSRRLETRTHELTLGAGTASVSLTASGSVGLRCGAAEAQVEQEASQAFARAAEDFSQKVSGEVESQLETQMKILDEQMAHLSESIAHSGVPPAEADRILRRARESSERANLRAQEKMQRAREKLDRKLATAQRRVEERERAAEGRGESQEKRTWSFDWPTTPSPAQSQSEASNEERLMILRMLEQKKISLAEAEQLLDALEGNSG